MDPDHSRRFLEEIDEILRPRRTGCFVLVSILGDGTDVAWLRERCDEVVALAPLRFADTHRLLGHNGLGLSIPFAALCHVLSGGVPKTLSKHARTLVATKASDAGDPAPELHRSAHVLLAAGLQEEADAFHARALKVVHPRSNEFMNMARAVQTLCGAARDLSAHAARFESLAADRSGFVARGAATHDELECLAERLAAHCQFAATVLEFFDDALSRAAIDHALRGEPPPLEILREARSVLTVNPGHASRLVRDFRSRCELEIDVP